MNARSTDVHEVGTTAEIRAFIEGERVDGDPGEGDATGGRAPALVVERVAPNGTVIETLEIYGDETVRVVRGNATEATDEA